MSDAVTKKVEKVRVIDKPIMLLAGLLLLQAALFLPSFISMVEIWWRSETFAHGFFILPITLYLVWRRRDLLARTPKQVDWKALPALLGICCLWLLAKLVDVLVIEQFSVVLMIPILVWLCLGLPVVRQLLFPLAFLLFAVPFGEFMVYPLMEFTAIFTVNAVRAVGIPVFWEGLYFTLPTGSWSVVEACSGFRYILASLTLGALYAYLTYQSMWRRTAFMVFAMVVPIVANGLRAFMIVMIGHYSGMELAVGVDHLIYGWVWFGIVMFFMFWVGSHWRENEGDQKPAEQMTELSASSKDTKAGMITIACACLILVVPTLLTHQSVNVVTSTKTVSLPEQIGDWERQNDLQLTEWGPVFHGSSQELREIYQRKGQLVGVHVAYFDNQAQGAELVSNSHRLISTEDRKAGWKDVALVSRTFNVGPTDVALTEVQIKYADHALLTWQWKLFDGVHTDNDFYLKVLEAWAELTGSVRHGAVITLFVEQNSLVKDGQQQASQQLMLMLENILPALEAEMR